MISTIYKEISFDASHRLLHDTGKCHHLHGHRWKVEVWMKGEINERTKILVDYNLLKSVVERFDHQVILNESDPMVACLTQFQTVIITPGDPTSEMIAQRISNMIAAECQTHAPGAEIACIRVWESPTCCAEIRYESS